MNRNADRLMHHACNINHCNMNLTYMPRRCTSNSIPAFPLPPFPHIPTIALPCLNLQGSVMRYEAYKWARYKNVGSGIGVGKMSPREILKMWVVSCS